MSTLPRTTEGRRGLTAFRLSDIPLGVRRTAVASLIRLAADSADPFAAVSLTRAVETPSDRVYWIPKEAWERECAKRRWKRK